MLIERYVLLSNQFSSVGFTGCLELMWFEKVYLGVITVSLWIYEDLLRFSCIIRRLFTLRAHNYVKYSINRHIR